MCTFPIAWGARSQVGAAIADKMVIAMTDNRRTEYSALIGRMERTLRDADDALAAATTEVKDSRRLSLIANVRTAIAKRLAETSALFDVRKG